MEKYKTQEPIEYSKTDIDYYELKNAIIAQGYKDTMASLENGVVVEQFEKGDVSLVLDFGNYLGMTISTTIDELTIKSSEIISHRSEVEPFIDKTLSQFETIRNALKGE